MPIKLQIMQLKILNLKDGINLKAFYLNLNR